MKIIAGLGNPGEKYKNTLHNTGFKVIDKLSSAYGISLARNAKIPADAGKGKIGSEDVLLLKPATFMNESGKAIKYLLNYYRISVSDLIVIYDDLDLDAGRIRIREKGSSAGHRGISSIIGSVNSQDFPRIRIGIGRPLPGRDAVEYVLKVPGKDKNKIIENAVLKAAEAIAAIIKEGIAAAMSAYNRKGEADE